MTSTVSPGTRRALQFGCIALIVVAFARLAAVLPRWMSGEPPTYPGEYFEHLSPVLVTVPLMTLVLLAHGRQPAPSWRSAVQWGLLALSVVGIAIAAHQR